MKIQNNWNTEGKTAFVIYKLFIKLIINWKDRILGLKTVVYNVSLI